MVPDVFKIPFLPSYVFWCIAFRTISFPPVWYLVSTNTYKSLLISVSLLFSGCWKNLLKAGGEAITVGIFSCGIEVLINFTCCLTFALQWIITYSYMSQIPRDFKVFFLKSIFSTFSSVCIEKNPVKTRFYCKKICLIWSCTNAIVSYLDL